MRPASHMFNGRVGRGVSGAVSDGAAAAEVMDFMLLARMVFARLRILRFEEKDRSGRAGGVSTRDFVTARFNLATDGARIRAPGGDIKVAGAMTRGGDGGGETCSGICGGSGCT